MEVGRALRLLIEGMVGILGARRSLKEEFRMDQTQLSASENNPLKFYKSADEVLRKTLGEPKPGFMPLDEAVRQGLIDLKAHEIASATALQSIFMRLLETFDPQQFESEGGGLLGRRTDKGKAYDQFVDSYRRMAANPDRAARDIVGPEFARAYADALQRLKTMER
jgi:type VI secretion system protein ImpI/type VI secretion system protein